MICIIYMYHIHCDYSYIYVYIFHYHIYCDSSQAPSLIAMCVCVLLNLRHDLNLKKKLQKKWEKNITNIHKTNICKDSNLISPIELIISPLELCKDGEVAAAGTVDLRGRCLQSCAQFLSDAFSSMAFSSNPIIGQVLNTAFECHKIEIL